MFPFETKRRQAGSSKQCNNCCSVGLISLYRAIVHNRARQPFSGNTNKQTYHHCDDAFGFSGPCSRCKADSLYTLVHQYQICWQFDIALHTSGRRTANQPPIK
ncbi:hypothetical protein Tsp_15013 [Trichinella spiralis]|uniref:hypothetical protein n=1 Tax=Trichinella spiralis TaxID=6334 RepID=UPI0001EFDEE9|nr:hypothetical protein Tsp_15013 [Trichinella spiralis]